MKRFKHSLSHYVLSTFDMGKLIPVCNFEVLPGDSIRMATSALLRVSPLLTPVMHPVVVRLHHWFVPYRILWDGWEDFITGGDDGMGGGAGAPPTFAATANGVLGSLGNYLGIPPGADAAINVSAFPFQAYTLIANEFYRDEDLQPEFDLSDGLPVEICWEKDYFTAARPWSQKGPDVVLPIGGQAPVRGIGVATAATFPAVDVVVDETETGPVTYPTSRETAQTGTYIRENTGGFAGTPAIYADLANATGASINDVRLAFALQRYQEARAQYGHRYVEYLKYLGVTSSDARLQRPEYLGGGRATISFSEVLKTGEGDTPSDDSPIGEMKGHGISALRTRRWTRFFEEHGVVMTLASIRPKAIYMNGVHKKFSRTTKEDYWQRELELIGQQEVLNKEIYAPGATPNGTFGFQDRYAEYRHHPSYVTGEFQTTLNDWHLARSFGSAPALNASFVECNPSKRIHAVQDASHTIWGMFSHSIQARRPVTRKTIGRIV